MSTPLDLYPLSTSDGKDIPLDVIRPTGWTFFDFTSSAATASSTLANLEDLMVFQADEDCIIRFDGVEASMPAAGSIVSNSLYLPKNTSVVVYTTQRDISVKGVNQSGTLTIQFVDVWHALGVPSQFTRG